MFETLMASAATRERTASSSVLSAAFHLLVIAGAFVATRAPATATSAQPARLYLDPYLTQPSPPHGPATSGNAPPAAPAQPGPFPSVEAPLAVVVMPVGAEPATGQREPLLRAPDHDPFTPEGSPLYPVPGNQLHDEEMVDEPVRLKSGPSPEYPAALRAAGLEGVVILRMVVDTSGRIEPGSIVVQQATHPAFQEAAVTALTQSRFLPARLRGQPVRQLVHQSVRFRLEQR